MARPITDIVNEGEALGVVGGVAASLAVGATSEQIDDRVAALLAAGANVTLTYDDAAGTLTIASTGGGSVAVEDEGSQILASATRLDFTGAGVTVTDGGAGQANITIPGGGSSSFVGVRATQTGTQSLAASTATAVALDAEAFDTHAFHDTTTNNGRFTVPSGQAGYYQVNGYVEVDDLADTKLIYVTLSVNGSETIVLGRSMSSSAAGDVGAGGAVVVNLAVGQYVELRALQTDTVARNIRTCHMSMHRIGS